MATIPACYYYDFRKRMILKLKQTPAIYLVGFMGCGKSAVGRALADELGWTFIDLDAEVEHAAGQSVTDIFEKQGEPKFRELETEALQKLIQKVKRGRPYVVSLGGGAFTIDDNFQLAMNHGVTVWLDTPLEIIESRIASESHRPLARNPERFRNLFEQRRSAYARCHYQIETGSGDITSVVSRIMALPLFVP